MLLCPLCSHQTDPYAEDRRRAYFHCPQCDLVSADPETNLDATEEKAYYDLHENNPADPGYRRFLSRLAQPLIGLLRPGMRGLDYGCGPGPTLSLMLEEARMIMEVHDPYYCPNPSALHRRYDFVTCTEVVEHFHHPDQEWARLVELIVPGGCLAIMTKLVISRERFASWHYKDDPTHIGFYSPQTFAWLGARFGLEVERVDQDVIFLQKR